MSDFRFMDPTANPLGMFPATAVQSPADFLKSLQGFSPVAMGNNRALPLAPSFTGLGGTLGDQAGDYSMPTMATNPGWASGAGTASGTGLFGGMFDGLDMKSIGRWLGGGTNTDGTKDFGMGSTLVGGLGALSSLYMGMKQYGLMKDQLGFAKDSFNKNWEAQVKTTNAQLEDRQNARVASNSTAYQSPSDYMKKYGIKG